MERYWTIAELFGLACPGSTWLLWRKTVVRAVIVRHLKSGSVTPNSLSPNEKFLRVTQYALRPSWEECVCARPPHAMPPLPQTSCCKSHRSITNFPGFLNALQDLPTLFVSPLKYVVYLRLPCQVEIWRSSRESGSNLVTPCQRTRKREGGEIWWNFFSLELNLPSFSSHTASTHECAAASCGNIKPTFVQFTDLQLFAST